VVTSASDPVVPWYDDGSWTHRCSGTEGNRSLPCPHGLVIPDAVYNATEHSTPNNAGAFLLPDGVTLVQMNPLARCVAGGPVYGGQTPHEKQGVFETLNGTGITGGHGGSGLSSVGGRIQPGELLPDAPPIAHALKCALDATLYYYDQPPGFRWPAVQRDSYAFNTSDPHHYGGNNSAMRPGSLLAVPPALAPAVMANLTTVPGKKILAAMTDYGCYIVDDAAQDVRQVRQHDHNHAMWNCTFDSYICLQMCIEIGPVVRGPEPDLLCLTCCR
jgi:hypothetical protein